MRLQDDCPISAYTDEYETPNETVVPFLRFDLDRFARFVSLFVHLRHGPRKFSDAGSEVFNETPHVHGWSQEQSEESTAARSPPPIGRK